MSRNYLHPRLLDSSLLTYQVHHRSESVWANREYKAQLSCVHYARNAFRNFRTNERVQQLLCEAGGSVLILGLLPQTTHIQPIEMNLIDVNPTTVRRRLIGNPDHRQAEGYLQTAPSFIATVEALRHINIHGEIAVEHGQNNSFTNVMQQIARDELVRLNYGYVLELPRNNEEFMYEPIHQVRVVDRRRDGSRRGRSAQGGRRHVISPPFNLNDELPIEAYDDPHNAPVPTQDDLDRDNKMGDISQQDVIQQVMTPYDNQLHMYWEGSSSQVPPHA
nr:uncharacterized protein LOC109172328 [Ipomoea batatas]